jgi:type IV conjugative transfer system coupling protein TraD
MALSNHLAQGGQTFLHKVRMVRQVLGLAFRLGLMVGLLVFGILMYRNVPLQVYEHVWKLLEARGTVFFMGKNAQMKNEEGGWVYARDRANHYGFMYNATVFLPYHLKRSALYGGSTLLGIMGLAFVSWSLKGRRDKRRKHLSGSQLISVRDLTRLLKRSNKASDLKLGTLPLVKDSETQHMLITGTTGSGKTNCFHTLLPQVRHKRQRAVIVDTTGEFVSRYYRPGIDILLNPLDARSASRHPWAECSEDYHYDELATNLIPLTSNDPFWVNSARTVLTETLKEYAKEGVLDIQQALTTLTVSPLKELYVLLKDTKAAPLVDPDSEKTALSIRSTLTTAITSLSYLKASTSPFSIRRWVQSMDPTDDRWVFFTMTPEQRDAVRPLITAWTSIAVKSLLGCSPNPHNRLWICIDELPSLHKLQDLQLCLAEGRKYGAAVILGVQNIPQLEERYGSNITKTMIDLCSTKVLFRAASYEIALSLSRALGEQEIMEVQEGISYGANDIRDGVNLALLKQLKPIVTAHDLMGLKNLEGYVMFPEFNAVTRITLPFVSQSTITTVSATCSALEENRHG